MKLLVSTPRKLLLVDANTSAQHIVESHRPEYYGITWDATGTQLVLGHSGLENSSLTTLESYVESECGWVSFGRSRGPSILSATHQVLTAGDRVIATNTGRNCITVFRTDDWFYRHYWIDDVRWDRKGRDDRCGRHLNSLFLHSDQLYAIAHNYDRGSEIIRFFWPEMEVIRITQTSAQMAHNIWITEDNQKIICDSMRGNLMDADRDDVLWTCPGDGVITRGLASDGDHVIIGQSLIGPREERTRRDGRLWIVDRHSWQTIDSIELRGSGNIHDVRILDRPDVCHSGVPFAGNLETRRAA